MGLRNLKTFNEALLAKQYWRILKEEESPCIGSLKLDAFLSAVFLRHIEGECLAIHGGAYGVQKASSRRGSDVE